jgi:hypothetical protein
MSEPAMGYFANGEPQTASGTVSATLDAGTPEEAVLLSVSVNGVACTITGPDANGNMSFTGQNPCSVSTNFTSATVTVCYTNSTTNVCHTIPLGVWEGYFIVRKEVTQALFGTCNAGFERGGEAGAFCDCCGSSDGWCLNDTGGCSHRRWYTFEGSNGTGSNEWTRVEWHWLNNGGQCVQTGTPDSNDLDFFMWWDEEQHGGPGQPTDPPEGFSSWPRARGLRFGDLDIQVFGQVDWFDPDFGWGYGDGIIDGEWVMLYQESNDGWIEFVAPVYYGTNTPVIFTFEGVSYRPPPGQTMNWTNVLYDGHSPVVVEGDQVGYLITVNGGQTKRIEASSFTWPSAGGWAATTNSAAVAGWRYCREEDLQVMDESAIQVETVQASGSLFTFSGFHNNACDITFIFPSSATKVYINRLQQIEFVARVADATDGTVIEWRFEDPGVELLTGSRSVGNDTLAGSGNDNNGDKDQNHNWLVGFVQAGGGVIQETTSTTQGGLAKIKFRTSSFGGDNYKIKAWVQKCGEQTAVTSPLITVWRKFTVEVDAMEDQAGGEFYPFQTGVGTAYSEVFIELAFRDDQVKANLVNTRYRQEINTLKCNGVELNETGGYIRKGSGNDGTTYNTSRDLHVIGIRKFANNLGRVGETCGRHSLVECRGKSNGQISYTTAHELGHGLGYPAHHPDQNAPEPGIMGTLGNVSIGQVKHFNSNQAELFRKQATPQYALPE